MTTIPETLKGFKCYPINRGDKMKPGAGMTFKLSAPAEVYLAVMDRGNPTLGQAWEKTDMKMDWMGDHVPFKDLIYKKSAPAGELKVSEHDGSAGKKKKTFGIPHLLIVPANIEVSISPSKKQKKMIPIHRDKLKPGASLTFKLSAPTEVRLIVMDPESPELGDGWENTNEVWSCKDGSFAAPIYKKKASAGLHTIPEPNGVSNIKKTRQGISHFLILPVNIKVSISESKEI